MNEVQNNELFGRDAETNALVPVLAASLADGDVLEVRNGRLHKRDAQTNALIPVVQVEGLQGGGGSGGGTIEISAADKVLKIEPDGLLAQLSLKKIGSSNSMSLTGLNSTTLLVASRAALEGVTSMKFSGRITGNASYAANPGYIRIAFRQAGGSVPSSFYNLHQLTAVGDFDQTFNSVDIILALRAALNNHPDWEAFEIIIVVDGYGFDGTISTVSNGTLAIDAEEKILLTGKDGETLASVKLEPPAAGVVSIPNYSAMESTNRITANNGEWTVDRNGYVVVSIQATGGSSALATINGRQVGQSYSGASAFLKDVYPVKIGDVVKLFVDGGTSDHIYCYFIPPVDVPTNLSGLINYPNQWPANTEIDLGNGLYGKRITGTITAAADERAAVNIQTGVSNVIGYGGTWGTRDGDGGAMSPVGATLTQSSGTASQDFISDIRLVATGYMGFYSTSSQPRSGGANTRYDVWVKYTK